MTYYDLPGALRGFVPQQDRADHRQRPAPRFRQPGPHARGLPRRCIIRADPGVAHSIGLAGISFIEQANSPQLRLLPHRSQAVLPSAGTPVANQAVMARLRSSSPRKSRMPASSCWALRRFPAERGRRVSLDHRRGSRRTWAAGPAKTIGAIRPHRERSVGDDVGKQRARKPPKPPTPANALRQSTPSSAPTRRSSTWTSTAPRSPPWASPSMTSIRCWRSISARSTSTASTISAATGR